MSTENNKEGIQKEKETIQDDIVLKMKEASLRSIATDLIVAGSDSAIDRAKENVAAILSITEESGEGTPMGYLKKRAEWTKGELETRENGGLRTVGPCNQILHALSKEIEAYLES